MSARSISERVRVAGLPVIDADVDDAVDLLFHDARRRSGTVYALINGYSAMLCRDRQEYRAAIEHERTIPLPDGIPLSLGSRLLGRDRVRRCPGPDLMEAACERAAFSGMRFFLMGGMPGTAERLRDVLCTRYPGLTIAGVATPPVGEWTAAESAALAARVVESGADVLWLGVSAPKQETWAIQWAHALEGVPVVCVGAAFDFLSGLKPRAPRGVRRAGFEWLYRLVTEPRRLWYRYLVGNVVFLCDLYADRDPVFSEQPESLTDKAG